MSMNKNFLSIYSTVYLDEKILLLLSIQLGYTAVHVPVTGVDSSRHRLLILQ